ncbi:uncharacterized protein LTR77_005766 [Saxophila tyrrhenica]|uniref:NDT80 domain-containing protein n=1 Tax=Saxophila tyrrhenica TaxID=1690608 RepID=A0AAV9PA86_9PEZI|nr:hypothetical protein LTR77_005766 [Saxophila tyrrhenica]
MDNLGGFDPSTMTYFSTQIAHPGAGGNDLFHDMMIPMEMPDHHATYGYGGYVSPMLARTEAPSDVGGNRSEDMNLHNIHAQTTPQLKRFPSTYEDPFSDVVSAFDPNIGAEQHDSETPSIDRDNKLLSFSLPHFDHTLLDYTYRRTTISLSAQLHGMFFLAESPWASAENAQPAPNELTCYRRNLFQITGEITIPRTLRYIMTEQGEQIPILGQELMISATESTEGNPVKIISVPWKTPVNPAASAPEDKAEREPPSIPLDLMNVQDMDSDYASFPFQWKRLQFRIATANNGRRKELQQHFVVRLRVMATLATGAKIPICEIRSGAIIVRGRSPRNFQSRKDLPLSGAGTHTRKGSNMPGSQAGRSTSNDSAGGGMAKIPENGPTSAPIKAEGPAQAQVQSYFEAPNGGNLDFFDWHAISQTQPGAMTALPPAVAPHQPDNIYAESSPELTRSSKPPAPPQAPISLSLVEEETPHTRRSNSPSDSAPPAKRIHLPPRPPSFSINTINSPDESADLLYEYFPLGLDDWMPPVDAVYRPHVVHHTKLPSDPRDPKGAGRGARSKRYFVEDVT